MICGFPKFPRICWRFCLLILYLNICLIVLYQFGIWCSWMFLGSLIWAWMLFRKCHNKFLFLDFLPLLRYLLRKIFFFKSEALKKSGYYHQLTYQKSISNKNKDTKRRKRKIIWTESTESTKVRNQFLKLINKHFPRYHKFYKLFNKNKVKVSYSCLPNMKNIICITKK